MTNQTVKFHAAVTFVKNYLCLHIFSKTNRFKRDLQRYLSIVTVIFLSLHIEGSLFCKLLI